MPHRTDIEWADYSSNPLRAIAPGGTKGHACVKISPGCANCYSEAINNRFGTQRDYTAGNMKDLTHYLDEKEMRHILKFQPKGPFKNGSDRPRVFPFDMTDLFGDWVDEGHIQQCLAAFHSRADVDWMVLTKRPERMLASVTAFYSEFKMLPMPNLWLGVSAETQKYADERVPWLLKTPAARRFVSAEPLLGPIDFRRYLPGWCDTCEGTGEIMGVECYGGKPVERMIECPDCPSTLPGLDLIIVGGESGPKARDCNTDWIYRIIEQCREADVACFVKQIGSKPTTDFRSRPADEKSYWTTLVNDPKGGEMSEWPERYRVRQMPRSAA
jgi:protein gp37